MLSWVDRNDALRAGAVLVFGAFCIYAVWSRVTVDIALIPLARRIIESPYTLPLALGGSAALAYWLFVVDARGTQPAATEHQTVIVLQQDGGVSAWAILIGAGLGLLVLWWLQQGLGATTILPMLGQQQMPAVTNMNEYEQAWMNVNAVAPQCAQWRRLAETYAGQYNIDPLLVVAVWYHESGCDAGAVNPTTRATGLGQVMPRDAWRFRDQFENRPTSAELVDPILNAHWSAQILAGTLRGNDTLYEALDDYSGGHGRSYYDSVTSIYRRFVAGVSQTQSQGYAGGRFPAWPSVSTRICGHYGASVRWQEGGHTGVDLCGGYGTPIRTVAAGIVTHVGELYGRHTVRASRGSACAYEAYRGPFSIQIDHGGGIVTTYSHNSEALVRTGQQVSAGQVIAREGNRGCVVTGRKVGSLAELGTSGSHLHFEVLVHGEFVDPMDYLPQG